MSPIRTPPTCVVVVPCYNEAERLHSDVFRSFALLNPGILFIFVNDGSSDRTADVLKALHSSVPDVTRVLECPVNRGKAEAVRKGMTFALAEMKPRFAGFWDADLATPLDAIPDLLQVLENRPGIDMVFGARVKLLGRYIKRNPVRHYLGRSFATIVSTMLRMPIYDTQCGAKLFRVNSGLADVLREPFLSRWIFDVEILARYIQMAKGDSTGLQERIYEYPLTVWKDIAGSKIRLKDFFRAFIELGKIYGRYLS
ncbi:MAG: glycosyltransferase family 2 protein [Acidobacteriota bacterium]|nr:glycosyltransferase family 2 protein [Acidobacteriota bacterium]